MTRDDMRATLALAKEEEEAARRAVLDSLGLPLAEAARRLRHWRAASAAVRECVQALTFLRVNGGQG